MGKTEKQATLTFRYTLTMEEAYAAFLYVGVRSRKVQKPLSLILLLLAAAMIVLYALHPERLEYMVLPLLILAVWYLAVPRPAQKARRSARKVAQARGEYRVELFADGTIQPWGENRLPLVGDSGARACETPELFILRPDRLHTICLPKRIMKQQQADEVRRILTQHVPKFTPQTTA